MDSFWSTKECRCCYRFGFWRVRPSHLLSRKTMWRCLGAAVCWELALERCDVPLLTWLLARRRHARRSQCWNPAAVVRTFGPKVYPQLAQGKRWLLYLASSWASVAYDMSKVDLRCTKRWETKRNSFRMASYRPVRLESLWFWWKLAQFLVSNFNLKLHHDSYWHHRQE